MLTEFYLPTRIVFGNGCIERIGQVTSEWGKRVLLVCGSHALQNRSYPMRAKALLEDKGLDVHLFGFVSGEADLDTVSSGLELLRQKQCDIVVGLGGGSAIDTAKAIAGLARLPGDIRAYHAGRQPEGPGLPLVAVPTTAGSGAEVTCNAVLIDPRTELKQSIRGDSWFPRAALVDPELTYSMGSQLTAYTGSDALCQAIESFTSIAASPITDGLAEKAIELLGHNLDFAVKDGQDPAIREAMSMGSLLAGMAMSNARLGAVHGMAHPLGSHYHIPHGLVCGLLLPHVMQYNLEYAGNKYARIAELLGCAEGAQSTTDKALLAVAAVKKILGQAGIPEHLGQFGVYEDAFDLIIRETMPSGSTKHNPRPLSETDIRNILISAL